MMKSARRPAHSSNARSVPIALALAVAALAVAVVAGVAGTARAAERPPSVTAGPPGGFVPSRNANRPAKPHGSNLLSYHGGGVLHNTVVVPVFWGSRWGNSTFKSDKQSGLDTLYSNIKGTSYAHTNSEYTDWQGHVNTTSISRGTDKIDTSVTPSGAPSTSQVLAEVAKATGNNPIQWAYYPVYSDQPRGTANYCAWHSWGSINGIQIEFGFFFNLDGDPGCDPQSSVSGESQGRKALANVSGHELSETLTDPQLNAWYDQQGNENADKCAWTWNGTVSIGGKQWKIQGNWSNAAAQTNSGYANGGCIQTS